MGEDIEILDASGNLVKVSLYGALSQIGSYLLKRDGDRKHIEIATSCGPTFEQGVRLTIER